MRAPSTAATLEHGAVASRRRRRIRHIRGLPILISTLFIFVTFLFVGTFAYELAPQDPHRQNLVGRLQPPAWQAGGNWEHPLGTDSLGRDELSRLIAGTRISLVIVVTAIPASLLVGTTLGLVAGWRRGLVERVLMRLVDIQLALPAILFAVLLAAKVGPGLNNVILILVVWSWAGFARVVRGEVLSLRQRDFITAARTLGGTDLWIVVRHVVPNIVNVVVIIATLDIAAVILAEAGLSFLGVGVPFTTPSWGGMISEGRNVLTIAGWLVWVPGLAILLVSLAGNLFGDWLRDALEPRLRHSR